MSAPRLQFVVGVFCNIILILRELKKSSKDDFSSLLQFLIKSVVVKSTLNVSCVENLMSLMAAGLAEELVIYTLDSRILM